jgi:hypothetical protein
MSIEEAFAAMAAVNPKKYLDARAAKHRAEDAENMHRDFMDVDAKQAGAPLRRAFARAMRPHRVEYGVSTGWSLAYDSGEISAHLDGEIWPATSNRRLYSMQVRAPIQFSMTPRDADEFRRIVAMLRAMADAATAGGP